MSLRYSADFRRSRLVIYCPSDHENFIKILHILKWFEGSSFSSCKIWTFIRIQMQYVASFSPLQLLSEKSSFSQKGFPLVFGYFKLEKRLLSAYMHLVSNLWVTGTVRLRFFARIALLRYEGLVLFQPQGAFGHILFRTCGSKQSQMSVTSFFPICYPIRNFSAHDLAVSTDNQYRNCTCSQAYVSFNKPGMAGIGAISKAQK